MVSSRSPGGAAAHQTASSDVVVVVMYGHTYDICEIVIVMFPMQNKVTTCTTVGNRPVYLPTYPTVPYLSTNPTLPTYLHTYILYRQTYIQTEPSPLSE